MTTIHVPDDPGVVNLWLDWLRPRLAAAVAEAIGDDDDDGEEEGHR
jgi:hypothetical protein